MTAEAAVTDDRETHEGDALFEIIRAAKAGDRAAFDEMMMLTERRVAQIAWSILRDVEEVKEAVQETFFRVFRHLRGYDERKDFHGWLVRISVNVCRDLLRRRGRVSDPIHEETLVGEADAERDAIRHQELTALRRAIDSLPTKERLAVVLHDIEGLTTGEVALALGNRAATVRVQLSHAREKLRHLLGGRR